MKIFKILKRRSILAKLPRVNAVRCNCTSLLAICMVTSIYLLDKFILDSGAFWSNYSVYLICILFISFGEIICLRIASGLGKRKNIGYRLSSNAYVILMALTLFLMADSFLDVTGSLALYFVALLFISIVPVLTIGNFEFGAACQVAVMAAYIFKYSYNPSFIIQVIIINCIMCAVNFWKYCTVLGSMELEGRLSAEMEISEQDPLTRLTNRRGLERKISTMFPLCARHKIPVGIIMLDIDQFKKYNDTFGHPQGDVCIKSISKALKETARRSTDVIARVGGEEFVVFVQEIDKADLILLAKKIQGSVENLAIKHAPRADFESVTVSVGLSYGKPETGCTFERLYGEADKALYMAKTNGRNCIGLGGRIISKNKSQTTDTMNSYEVYYTREAKIAQ